MNVFGVHLDPKYYPYVSHKATNVTQIEIYVPFMSIKESDICSLYVTLSCSRSYLFPTLVELTQVPFNTSVCWVRMKFILLLIN